MHGTHTKGLGSLGGRRLRVISKDLGSLVRNGCVKMSFDRGMKTKGYKWHSP